MSPSDKPTLLSLAFKPLPTPQHLAMHRTGTGILALAQRQEQLGPLAQSGAAPTPLASPAPLWLPTTLYICHVSIDV